MDSMNNACKFGSDAWLELQAFKTRQLNRREKLSRHRELINGIALGHSSHQPLSPPSSLAVPPSSSNSMTSGNNYVEKDLSTASNQHPIAPASPSSNNALSRLSNSVEENQTISDGNESTNNDKSNYLPLIDPGPAVIASGAILHEEKLNNFSSEIVECLLIMRLCDVALKLPIDSRSLRRSICKIKSLEGTTRSQVENLLQKFAHQELITIEEPTPTIRRKKQSRSSDTKDKVSEGDEESCIYVTSADHTKLVEFDKSFGSLHDIKTLLLDSKQADQSYDEVDNISQGYQAESVPIQSIRTSIQKDRDDGSTRDFLDNTRGSRVPNEDYQSSNLEKTASTSRASKGDDLESLLSLSSTKERESKKLGEELLELLSKPTAKERNLLESFRSADGYQVQEFCPKGTKGECRRNNNGSMACKKLHFKKIIAKHTEESLGDCSFLNTCFHMDSCKYVHYEVDYDDDKVVFNQQHQFKRPHPALERDSRNHDMTVNNRHKLMLNSTTTKSSAKTISIPETSDSDGKFKLSHEEQARLDAKNRKRFKIVLYPPQWIQCDLRFFDMSLLGKFSVVMADPPWDIHMELPYGTMSDEEMRKLNIPALQDEGVIFLWVTGRAMELGRECLALWGYERCDEIIWVKTNQLQRIIRTGRTGHWLNHGKEHCLVGVKGNPKDINRGLDCDVIVAEVRATSHKPDEIYGIIERLSPGTRKIELFGRTHNVQPNWITLGNQLNGVRLIEPDLVNAFKKINLPFQTGDVS